MKIHSTHISAVAQPVVLHPGVLQPAAVYAGVAAGPVPARWWSGCRVIGLASITLWVGIWQIVAYLF